jgi:hypothetical protein
MAGDFVARITGQGEYHVAQNTLMNPEGVPKFTKTRDGIRITHKEMFKVVEGSVGFTNTVFDINPANPGLFPWLSTLADSYSTYSFNGLVIMFKSTSAQAVGTVNTALGRVCMASMYDVLQPPFVTMVDMEAHEFSNSCKPSEPCLHGIECKKSELVLKDLYVSSPDQPYLTTTNSDQRFHDLAKFQFATEGMQMATQIGELWVTYDIELKINRMPINNHTFSHWVAANADAANPIGDNPIEFAGGTARVKFFPATGEIEFAEPGDYLLTTALNVATGVISVWNIALTSGSWTVAPNSYWWTNSSFYTYAGIGTDRHVIIYAFRTNVPNSRIGFTLNVTGTSAVQDFLIQRLPHGSAAPPVSFASIMESKAPVPRCRTWRDRAVRTLSIPAQPEGKDTADDKRPTLGPVQSSQVDDDNRHTPSNTRQLRDKEYEIISEETSSKQCVAGKTGSWMLGAISRS